MDSHKQEVEGVPARTVVAAGGGTGASSSVGASAVVTGLGPVVAIVDFVGSVAVTEEVVSKYFSSPESTLRIVFQVTVVEAVLRTVMGAIGEVGRMVSSAVERVDEGSVGAKEAVAEEVCSHS